MGTYPGDDSAGAGGDEQEQAEGEQEPAHGAGAGAVSPGLSSPVPQALYNPFQLRHRGLFSFPR